ncbi:MAG TPA: hypothetical protein VK054_03890 [Beutenbergiaceae bacterium]|nr:hypothetical protein [Beutenbergiaceae bacterium]
MTLNDRVQTLIEEGIPYDVIHLGISRAHYDTITKQEAHEMVYQYEDADIGEEGEEIEVVPIGVPEEAPVTEPSPEPVKEPQPA